MNKKRPEKGSDMCIGCNWETCATCFPYMQGKLPVTDQDYFNRAVEIANGARMRDTERLDPIAVARHASKLLSRRA